MSETSTEKSGKLKDTAWAISSIVVAIIGAIFTIIAAFAQGFVGNLLTVDSTTTPTIVATATSNPTDVTRFDIFITEDQFSIFFPGSQIVTLEGLVFESVISDSEISRTPFQLQDYPMFSSLLATNLPVPLCLILRNEGTSPPLPSQCEGTTTFTQEIASSDRFWWNDLVNEPSFRVIRVLIDDVVVGTCLPTSSSAVVQCSIDI